MLEQQIKRILDEFRSDALGRPSPQELRNKYLGRKNGVITLLMKELQQVPAAEKPAAGKRINELKVELEAGLSRLEEDAATEAQPERNARREVAVVLALVMTTGNATLTS
jgi:phenylalanyl-tRNA synthetase alpha subunit